MYEYESENELNINIKDKYINNSKHTLIMGGNKIK